MENNNKVLKEQLDLLNLLGPFVQEYLIETKQQVSVEQYLKELALLPIRIEGIIVGFWAVRYGMRLDKKLITIKGFYLKPEYRGKYRNKVADDLIRGLSKQGIEELEIWADNKVQAWLEKRYNIKPIIFVTHNPINAFQISQE